MPETLIAASTRTEIAPFLAQFSLKIRSDEGFFRFPGTGLSVLISGVGMLNMAYYMGRYSSGEFAHAINGGICGAFKRELHQGEVVNVIADTASEMGAEDDETFIRYLDLGLGGTNTYYNQMHTQYAAIKDLRSVKGITVNTVHGNEESIAKTTELFDPDVESMEGAAFFRGCQGFSGNYIQLRAVSNYVEKRDKSRWRIEEAIESLNKQLIILVSEILHPQKHVGNPFLK